MKRRLLAAIQGLLLSIVVLFLCDWGVFLVRKHKGTALGSVELSRYLSTALKGEKYEYDYLGSATVVCSHSIFPRGAYTPCWWLERHKSEWEH